MAKRKIDLRVLSVLMCAFIFTMSAHAQYLQDFIDESELQEFPINESHTQELLDICLQTTTTYIPICDSIGKPLEGKYVIEREYQERFGGLTGCGVRVEDRNMEVIANPLPDGSYECIVTNKTVGGNDCLGRCGAGCAASPFTQYTFTQECFNHDLCVMATGLPRGGLTGPCANECSAARYGYFNAPNCSAFHLWLYAAGVQGSTSVSINGTAIGDLEINDDVSGYLLNKFLNINHEIIQEGTNTIYIPAPYSAYDDIYDDIQIKKIILKEWIGDEYREMFRDNGTYHIGDQTIAEIQEAYEEGSWYDPNPPGFWTELIGSSFPLTFEYPSGILTPLVKGDGVKAFRYTPPKQCQ